MADGTRIARPEAPAPCVVLIGMAGSGKTTVGQALARRLGFGFLDTDHLIEAAYGTELQAVTDALDGPAFLDMEAAFVSALRVGRCVVATGGSVVYRESGMRHLRSMGPVVCLDAPLSVIQERIARNPDRGLVMAPGQSLAELYRERCELYERYADLHVDATRPPDECVARIARGLEERGFSL